MRGDGCHTASGLGSDSAYGWALMISGAQYGERVIFHSSFPSTVWDCSAFDFRGHLRINSVILLVDIAKPWLRFPCRLSTSFSLLVEKADWKELTVREHSNIHKVDFYLFRFPIYRDYIKDTIADIHS